MKPVSPSLTTSRPAAHRLGGRGLLVFARVQRRPRVSRHHALHHLNDLGRLRNELFEGHEIQAAARVEIRVAAVEDARDQLLDRGMRLHVALDDPHTAAEVATASGQSGDGAGAGILRRRHGLVIGGERRRGRKGARRVLQQFGRGRQQRVEHGAKLVLGHVAVWRKG